jgi:tetratricopeptide (TPR) repeat protein
MWGTLERRPYMRARYGLAETLWRLGRRDEAIEHERALMRLNPGDNQGVRFRLVSHLLEEGRDPEVPPCMGGFRNEASASWLYSFALWTFRAEGPTWRAEARLRRAFAANPHVPGRIVHGVRAPARLPAAVAAGDGAEAVDYTFDAMGAWRSTGGAVEWLAEVLRRALH